MLGVGGGSPVRQFIIVRDTAFITPCHQGSEFCAVFSAESRIQGANILCLLFLSVSSDCARLWVCHWICYVLMFKLCLTWLPHTCCVHNVWHFYCRVALRWFRYLYTTCIWLRGAMIMIRLLSWSSNCLSVFFSLKWSSIFSKSLCGGEKKAAPEWNTFWTT